MTGVTENLHKRLTERGVEYWVRENEYFKETYWRDTHKREVAFSEFSNGATLFACEPWDFTPEQAVIATLGYRTCHLEETVHQREIASEFGGGYYNETTYDCDECGFENIDYNIRFCGGCGAEAMIADGQCDR